MRKITVETFCDECNTPIEEGKAELVTLHAFGKVYESDLCEDCAINAVTYLRIKSGTKPQAKSIKCGTCPATFVNNNNLSRHMKNIHGVNE